ncbi:glutamine synthetase family protein [Natribaculum luteum]|uniref:Glutamine synthetase family protein n=1 Tax=Natribaculum luteum TaxID=1586232 RepID=A0ABD5P374_9EURY|nr:glutamine synthetase family protein [Natribaculum luteum]
MERDSSGTEMERQIDELGIDHVFVEFPDINGISRSKQLSAEKFLSTWETGPTMNLAVLVQTPRNEVPEGSGLAEEIGFADGRLRPLPETFRPLPWRKNAARVLCDLEYRGEPVAAAPRQVLNRLLDEHGLGIDLFVGSELEFYLLEATDGGYAPVTDDKHECVSWATEEVGPFYEALSKLGEQYGVPLESLQHEHGPGQLEVLFDYGDPLSQADRTFDFKRLVKQTARLSDRYATFMAKPFADESGSGYHLHVSGFEGEENAFADGDTLSDMGQYFVGGLMEHAPALAAIGTPTLNGFKRYVPDGFVPCTASWGYDNRQTAVRIPSGIVRVESRIGSADANPYLVIAATLAAGIDGVRNELEPGDPVEGNPAGQRTPLPRSPSQALAALEADTALRELLGEDVIQAYLASKRQELQSFWSTVTQWERDQYVETL